MAGVLYHTTAGWFPTGASLSLRALDHTIALPPSHPPTDLFDLVIHPSIHPSIYSSTHLPAHVFTLYVWIRAGTKQEALGDVCDFLSFLPSFLPSY